jgi:hypothetical protein
MRWRQNLHRGEGSRPSGKWRNKRGRNMIDEVAKLLPMVSAQAANDVEAPASTAIALPNTATAVVAGKPIIIPPMALPGALIRSTVAATWNGIEARNQGSTSWSHRPIPKTIAANAQSRGGSRMSAHRSLIRRNPSPDAP